VASGNERTQTFKLSEHKKDCIKAKMREEKKTGEGRPVQGINGVLCDKERVRTKESEGRKKSNTTILEGDQNMRCWGTSEKKKHISRGAAETSLAIRETYH